MADSSFNLFVPRGPLPVEIVLHPSWWYKNAGITFDEDFYFNPLKRVEVEKLMEKTLYDRWGKYGLGPDRDKDLPLVGAVHLAAGFIISEMLGCKVEYPEDASPQVICAEGDTVSVSPSRAFNSPVFKKFSGLLEALKTKYGYLAGDVNWSGVLNVALDLWGQEIFLSLYDKPEETVSRFRNISEVIESFNDIVQNETGSTSISVNRNVLHFPAPLYLHSECSLTMISVEDYERFLLPIDIAWSGKKRPFGIHYCGSDPHRFARSFAKIPRLDFLDLGWGGDINLLRKHLPRTFFNLRLSPVEFAEWSPAEIEETVKRLVKESGNPRLTGVCCINLDDRVRDDQIEALLKSVSGLRNELFPEGDLRT
jgi:hypothetical protein